MITISIFKKVRAPSRNVFRKGLVGWFGTFESPPPSTSDWEAEHIVDYMLNSSLLLELFAQLIAGVRGRTGTEGVLPALLETLFGGLAIASYFALRATRLVDVGLKEKIELPTAAFCSHCAYLLKVQFSTKPSWPGILYNW